MKFIDSHHHIWKPYHLPYTWLRDIGSIKPFGDPTPIQRDYEIDEFLKDAGDGLMASVHLQCDPGLPDPVAETAWITDIHNEFGFPNALVAFVDMTRDDAAEILAQHQAFPLLRGIRQIVSYDPINPQVSFRKDNLLENKTWLQHLELIASNDLTFDLQLLPFQAERAARVFADIPNLKVVVDHAGSPHDQSDSGIAFWKEAISKLAQVPNMHMKLCGFGMFRQDWDAINQASMIDHIIREFGSERVMVGSNFPVDSLMRDYDFVKKQWQAWLNDLPEQDKNNILWKSCSDFYQLGF